MKKDNILGPFSLLMDVEEYNDDYNLIRDSMWSDFQNDIGSDIISDPAHDKTFHWKWSSLVSLMSDVLKE